MVTCDVCGGGDFEVHAGFMYCTTCQTQSQEYHEQEHEFQSASFITRAKSKRLHSKKKNSEVYDDGIWTSYEAFNHILYGMTQELKKCEVPPDFEELVLKLWACYLKECGAAFTSMHREEFPKLGINFKHRDARILYNIKSSAYSRRSRCSSRSRSRSTSRSRSVISQLSNSSNSSSGLYSKYHRAKLKSQIIASEYQKFLSNSMLSNSFENETLETLGRSSETEHSQDTEDESDTSVKSFKKMFSKKDYKLYKKSYKSSRRMMSVKNEARRDVKCAAKNKLLSIFHLALLMTGSDIQLSDLLRFIREGHLSYAKVSHFLPDDVKFSKCDFSYIDVVADAVMPTHLNQRKISSKLAYLLKIDEIPTPNMALLVERYCCDLNLPEQIVIYCKKVFTRWLPKAVIPRAKTSLPSYEAWAMASIIFVMKLMFGLNDRTEMVLSDLARNVNSFRKGEDNRNLFVFEDWQKFIECRKTVLIEYHYPTQEQLNGDAIESSKNFLNVLMKESKDEHRNARFIPYPKYYMNSELISEIKKMLGALTEPQDIHSIDFEPSLTPQTSYTETIIQKLSREINESNNICKKTGIPEDILNQNFKKCDVSFAFDPKSYLKLLQENNCPLSTKLGHGFDDDLLFDCSSKYWIFNYPNSESSHLGNFNREVLEKTPRNFQWMMAECARMLEMNIRDVYNELLQLEHRFSR